MIERFDPKIKGHTVIGEEHIKRYEFASGFVKEKKVLDIACGAGYGSLMMAQSGAERVTGVDIDADAISECNKNYQAANLEFIRADAFQLPFEDNYFDLIISFETIEHLDNDKKFLAEIKRVLAPRGQFVISTPNRRVVSWRRRPFNKFHIKEYLKEEFTALVSQYFRLENIYGQRQIYCLLAFFAVKKIVEKALRIFKLYDWAKGFYYAPEGPKITPIKPFFQPTYYIAVAIK